MELKVSEVVGVYRTLKDAKLTKMESADKFKVIKIMRPMQGVADEWDKFMENVDKKLQKENHEEIIEKARKWQQEGEKTTLTDEEKVEINRYLMAFQQEKDECVKDELEKVVSLDFEKLTQDAFEKLIDSNDWEVSKMMQLEIIATE